MGSVVNLTVCGCEYVIVCVFWLVRKRKQEEEEAEQKKRATEAAYQGEGFTFPSKQKVNSSTKQIVISNEYSLCNMLFICYTNIQISLLLLYYSCYFINTLM